MKCSQCGAEVKEGAKFCGKCGSSLIQQPVQPIQPQVQPVQPQIQQEQPRIPYIQRQEQIIQPQVQPVQPQIQQEQPQVQYIQQQEQPSQPQVPLKNKEKRSKKKMPTWAKVLSVVLALIIVVTGTLVGFNVIPLSKSVKVPYVIGEDKTTAKEILSENDLFILIVGKKDSENDIAKNLICEQIPGEGTKLEKNSAVSVYLSKGPKMGYMPQIVYYTLDKAKEEIDKQGLGVQIAYEHSDEVAENGVIKQETVAETPVQQGETVKITVSDGSSSISSGTYKLPNIVGKDFDAARAELLKNGVYLLINEAKFDDNIPENQIIVQSKASGTTVNKGETVYVTISLGKEKVRVPDVTYLDKDEAVSTLEALGLTVKETDGNDPDVSENLILAQSADAGTLLEKGAEITLTVNKWEDETAGDESATGSQINSLEATDEDFENFEEMLSAYWNDGFMGVGDLQETFDLEKITIGDIFEHYLIDGRSDLYNFIYDEDPEIFDSNINSAFTTYKINADKADWIIKNVFEKTPDRTIFSDNEYRGYYYENDYLYLSGVFECGEPCDYKVVEKNRLKDGTYGIAVLQYRNFAYDETVYPYYSYINYYVAKLKEDKDMGRYWCILKGTQNERCFDLPEGATDKTTIFTEYTNAMMQQIKNHKSTLYTEEYDLLNYSYYTLYDINGDGTEELIVNPADCEAGSMFYFYTFKNNKAVYCGYVGATHSGLYILNGELYRFVGQGEVWSGYKINFENGKVSETEAFKDYHYDGDYKNCKGATYIEMSSSYFYTELVEKLLLD